MLALGSMKVEYPDVKVGVLELAAKLGLALYCSSNASGETVGILSEIKVFKGPAICRASPKQYFEGSLKPMPPSLPESTRRSRSAMLAGSMPVRVGMSFVRMVSSSSVRMLLMF